MDAVTLGLARAFVEDRSSSVFGRALEKLATAPATFTIVGLGDSGLYGGTVDSGLTAAGASVAVGRKFVDDALSLFGAALAARFPSTTIKVSNRAESGHNVRDALHTAVSMPADLSDYFEVSDANVSTGGVLTSAQLATAGTPLAGRRIYIYGAGGLSYRGTVGTVDSSTQVTVTGAAGPATPLVGTWARFYNGVNVSSAPFTKALADNGDLYLVSFFHNDLKGRLALATAGTPLAETMSYLEHVFRRLAVDLGKPVAFLAEWPYIGGLGGSSNVALRSYNAAARELCADYGVEYVDGYSAFIVGGVMEETLADATNHPNKAGHAAWYSAVAQHLPARVPKVRAVPPVVRLDPRYSAWKLDYRGLVNLTTVANTGSYGTDRIRLLGTGWSPAAALTATTSTAGDQVVAMYVGSDAYLQLTGTGTVHIDVDGVRITGAAGLALAGGGTIALSPTVGGIGGMLPGIHNVQVTLVSGSMTFAGLYYAPGGAEWWSVASARNTFTGASWAAQSSSSTTWNNQTRTSSPTNTGDSFTVEFEGTGFGISALRYNSAHSVSVAIDGAAATTVATNGDQQGGAAGLSLPGATVLASGLPYGRHTAVVTFTAASGTMQLHGFFAFDETRCRRPFRQTGAAAVADVVNYATPFRGRPRLRVNPIGAGDAYQTSPTASGFTVAGTASLACGWEAEGDRVVY